MNETAVEGARAVRYEFEVSIDAPRDRVWKALTGQVSSWWLPDFQMLGPDSVVTLEPIAGGRLFEECGDKGLLWYTVLAISPGESLSLAGFCTQDFGGPCTTLLSVKLTPDGGGTKVCVSDGLFGRVADEQVVSLESGWKRLFSEGLKNHVERG